MNKRFFLTILALGVLTYPASGFAQVSGDILCPNPEQAAKNTPRNLSDVQADIERFDLCVERAKLLNELNELSKKNEQDVLNRNFVGTGPAASLSGSGLPPLPGIATDSDFAALPPVEENDIVSFEDAVTPPKPTKTSSAKKTNWALRNVYGSSGTLNAELISTDGEIANVTTGDTLLDGSKVKRVSALGVVLTKNGKDIPVQWVE